MNELPLNMDIIEKFRHEINAPAQTNKPNQHFLRKIVEHGATLADLNLEKELVEQYLKIKTIMDEVVHDDRVPANQRAQVANSVVGALQQLHKLQEDMQREERLKIMEACLIDALKVLPDKTKEEFFEYYEATAKKAGLL